MTKLLLAFLGCLLALPGWANSPVWEISKNGHKLFIGGAMHILKPSDFPLPDAFSKAYQQADALVFETDMDALKTPQFQQLYIKKLTYQDGTTLNKVLKPATIKALKGYLQHRQIPYSKVQNYKPSFISIMMTMVEMQHLGVTSAGVDQSFFDKGKKDHKKLIFLETPRQQLSFLAKSQAGQEDHYIMYSLHEIKHMQSELDSMRNDWRKGNFNALSQSSLLPMKKEFPGVYHTLIVNRNNAWMPRLKSMLTTKSTEFVIVGALHLAGPDGLLAQFKKAGYQLQEVD